MAHEQTVRTIVLNAGEDLSAAAVQFSALIMDANGDVVLSTLVTDVPIGILQNSPKSGEQALIALLDGSIQKMVAGDGIAINSLIGLHATNGAVDDVVAVGDVSFGKSIEAVAAAGEIVSVLTHSPLRRHV